MNRLTRLAISISTLPALFLSVSPCLAYPISPVTLWDLVDRAELVVVAEVTRERALESGLRIEADGSVSGKVVIPEDSVARLRVIEIWKGARVARVRVLYPANLICPAPPRYVEGETVIAFLHKDEGGWRTVGLSYGTLYPAEDEMHEVRAMVLEAVQLQSGPPVPEEEYLEWLVRAAPTPGTRWHGLYPLLPASDRLHSFYEREREKRGLVERLTPAQLGRIAAGFVDRPPVDRTLPMALEVLAGESGEEIDLAAVSAMEALLKLGTPPWWLREAMEQLLRRFGDPYRGDRMAELGDTFDEMNPETLRSIWRDAREDLSIPEVEPAPLGQARVRGVGAGTPD